MENNDEKRRKRKSKAFRAEIMRASHFPFSPELLAETIHRYADKIRNFESENFVKLTHELANEIGSRKKTNESLHMRAEAIRCIYELPGMYTDYAGDGLNKTTAELIKDLMEMIWDSEGNLRSRDAKHAADTRHSKPGGSRDKKEKIREIWASGKYSSRDICAEQECAAIEMSFSAARKALRNTPDPT